jgi:hypothetical protein
VPISVREIYDEICNGLLEPGGLTGQVVTDDDFLRLLNDALRNILQSSACFLKINNIPAQLGVRIYDHAYYINQPTVVLSDESNIYQGSGNYWDNSDYRWQQAGPGTPQEWRIDQLQEDQIEVRPAPAWNGYSPSMYAGFYGTFSNTSSATTFDISYDPASVGMYGTISKTDLGDVYTEFVSPMYGIISDIQESTLNISEITTYTFDAEIDSIDSYIQDLPMSFKPYVKFMTLSMIYSMDGESKNDSLSKYYKQRANELMGLLRSVSSEILIQTVQ